MTVEDGERSTVLDAMALLGGNEYLVQQMVEASVGPNYSNNSNILVKLNFLAYIQFIYQYFSNFNFIYYSAQHLMKKLLSKSDF